MIAGYHLILTPYGWWLPNDPRGSMSREIRAPHIADLGEIHFGRRRSQPAGRIVGAFREAARAHLKHSLLAFSEAEIAIVGAAFGEASAARNYTCYGCAILADHVHLLIRKHRDSAEAMLDALQQTSRAALQRTGARPADHPVWGGPGWKVFLETREDMERTVAYIDRNLRQVGRRGQNWPFIRTYDGWLPGQVRVVRHSHA